MGLDHGGILAEEDPVLRRDRGLVQQLLGRRPRLRLVPPGRRRRRVSPRSVVIPATRRPLDVAVVMVALLVVVVLVLAAVGETVNPAPVGQAVRTVWKEKG